MQDNAAELACLCARLADERKAEDILVLNVGPVASFTDYFVIATGRNERQIKAIAEEVTHRVKGLHGPVLGTEGSAGAGWVLIDLGDTIVHLFSPETRQLYDLELLWGEAQAVDWQETPVPPPSPAAS